MISIFRLASCLAFIGCFLPAGFGQDAAAVQEIRELRALVERQSKQIEILTEQLARLNHALEGKIAGGAAPVPVAVAAPVVEFSTDTPKAEPPNGKRHVVIKGETLTSIAKHYNIPLAELQKANKGIDERKLQIGQSLTIPPSTTPDTATEKKENP